MNKDKDLLLKYLCMALPYGVICEYTSIQDGLEIRNEIGELTAIDKDVRGLKHTYVKIDGHLIGLSDFKPYLRPMSSMTDEEKSQYNFYLTRIECGYDASLFIGWLLKKHFDFMGLIPKGLAIEVTKENNPYENGL